MKKSLNIFLVGLFALLMLGSCEKENLKVDPTDKGEGKVSLTKLAITVSNAETIIDRSSSVDISNFIVNIIDKKDNEVKKTWAYKKMPEIITLPVGDYIAEVKSHVVKAAEWDAPYFYGSQEFTVAKDELTDIAPITCTIQNIKVTIKFDDNLKAVMGTDVVVNVVVGDKGSLDFAYNETRSGYFEYVSDSKILVATFTGTVDGSKESGYKIFVDIAPGQHRIITYSLKDPSEVIPPEFGEITPSFLIDASVKTIDLTVNVPGGEDVIEPSPGPNPNPDPDPDPEPEDNAPTITSTSINVDGNNIVTEGMIADVDILSENGITGFTVDIISASLSKEMLTAVGLDDHLDLVNPGNLEEGIKSLGFPVKEEVVGKTSLKFSITEFMPMLQLFADTHKFKLTVTDSKGLKVVKTLTFIVQ